MNTSRSEFYFRNRTWLLVAIFMVVTGLLLCVLRAYIE